MDPLTFPEPQHTSRDPWPDDIAVPVAVARMQRQAEAAGCLVRVQYSRGHGTHATHGRPTSLCHWIGVRIRRPDGVPAYAIYVRAVRGTGPWKWQSIRTPDRRLTLTELTAWITGSLTHPTTT